MRTFDLREWALKGAEQRLLEIGDEAKAIFAAFPELRGRGRGFEAGVPLGGRGGGSPRGKQSGASDASSNDGRRRRRRRKMSAAGRKRISETQKARWAKHRAAKKS